MSDRKKVLMFASNPVDGTSFYRGWGAWSRVPNVELTPYCGQKDWPDLIGFDAAVFQRPASQFGVRMIEVMKTNKIPVIVDYDDDVFNVPEDNQVFDYYNREDIIASVKACFNLADIVTVSTPALRDSILTHCPDAKITVIPNAIDDKRFKFKRDHKRDKSILMRGAGSHGKDWGQYEEELVRWFNSHPDWTLQVMGFTPHWLNQIKNIKCYEFLDIPHYFELLETLNPSLMLVPLEDTLFNRSKSNCSQLEGLIAGAPCFASDLPEFAYAEKFSTSDELITLLDDIAVSTAWYDNYLEIIYKTQLKFAPLLSQVNEQRLDILETIKSERKVRKVATDLEFHEYALSHGLSNDYPDHDSQTDKITKYVVDTFNPRFVMELGAGNGGLLYKLLQKGIVAYGLEINPHEAAYFQNRYPVYAKQMIVGDITTEPLVVDEPGDLVISVEVFEHIDKPDEWWVAYLGDLATKFRNFYFTSTPFHYIEEQDVFWGHRNIKLQSQWRSLFENAGWLYIDNPRILANWDLLFKSTKV